MRAYSEVLTRVVSKWHEEEAALTLAEALQTDLVFRLDLLHQAGAPKLILAASA